MATTVIQFVLRALTTGPVIGFPQEIERGEGGMDTTDDREAIGGSQFNPELARSDRAHLSRERPG